MILCNANKSGRVLTMSYSQHVGAEQMGECLEIVRGLMTNLEPGFLLLTDLSNLESMDIACAPALGGIMDLCSANEMATVVRVIPDPTKDIGFDLISKFHHRSPIKTQTYENLAEAIADLLIEPSQVA